MSTVPLRSQPAQPLAALKIEVERARTHVAAGRARGTTRVTREDQRHRYAELLDALDAYALGARKLGAPMPYRYRDDMRLLHAVYPQMARHQSWETKATSV